MHKWQANENEEKMVHRDEVLLKLFFGKTTSKETCIKLLKNDEKLLVTLREPFSTILAVSHLSMNLQLLGTLRTFNWIEFENVFMKINKFCYK